MEKRKEGRKEGRIKKCEYAKGVLVYTVYGTIISTIHLNELATRAPFPFILYYAILNIRTLCASIYAILSYWL